MIVGGLMAVAPVFGPLEKTFHYLADFIAERPQPMRGARYLVFRRAAGSDHLSHRAAPVCHIAGIIYPERHANPAARMIATSTAHRPMKPPSHLGYACGEIEILCFKWLGGLSL
jgi:hypothetical protein